MTLDARISSVGEAPKRLASWGELCDHVHATYGAREADGRIGVAAESAAAVVELRPIDVLGRPWLEVRGVLTRGGQAPSRPVLAKNFELPIGSLGMVDVELSLRQFLPLGALLAAALDDTIACLTATILEGARTP